MFLLPIIDSVCCLNKIRSELKVDLGYQYADFSVVKRLSIVSEIYFINWRFFFKLIRVVGSLAAEEKSELILELKPD
jgi:hypothetical protein